MIELELTVLLFFLGVLVGVFMGRNWEREKESENHLYGGYKPKGPDPVGPPPNVGSCVKPPPPREIIIRIKKEEKE